MSTADIKGSTESATRAGIARARICPDRPSFLSFGSPGPPLSSLLLVVLPEFSRVGEEEGRGIKERRASVRFQDGFKNTLSRFTPNT